MKTIKVFLASSDELKEEREKFGDLIRKLDDIFIKRGIHVQLLVWEDFDPSYNNCRKQDEYNELIRESQIFVALFYTRAGQYTLEEVEVARTENIKRKEPKLMIYCRNLQPGDIEEKELLVFKQELERQLGHFWCSYSTTDKLHNDFTMFFMRMALGSLDALKVENGRVTLDGITVAQMKNLPFASGNEGYQRMQSELKELDKYLSDLREKLMKKKQKLEKKKARFDKEPDDEDNREEYEEAKDDVEELTSKIESTLIRYNDLKEEFADHQQALFETAKRVSLMQIEKVSVDLRHAIEEFEIGHIEGANAILDVLENDANRHIEQFDCDRMLIHQDIEALLLQAKVIMADSRTDIATRKKRTYDIYKKADDWANKSALDKNKHLSLLIDYVNFVHNIKHVYSEAVELYERILNLANDLKVDNYTNTIANCYDNIGVAYRGMNKFVESLEFHQKSLEIRRRNINDDCGDDIYVSYVFMARTYKKQGDYANAIKNLSLALDNLKNKNANTSREQESVHNEMKLLYREIELQNSRLKKNHEIAEFVNSLRGNHVVTLFQDRNFHLIYNGRGTIGLIANVDDVIWGYRLPKNVSLRFIFDGKEKMLMFGYHQFKAIEFRIPSIYSYELSNNMKIFVRLYYQGLHIIDYISSVRLVDDITSYFCDWLEDEADETQESNQEVDMCQLEETDEEREYYLQKTKKCFEMADKIVDCLFNNNLLKEIN